MGNPFFIHSYLLSFYLNIKKRRAKLYSKSDSNRNQYRLTFSKLVQTVRGRAGPGSQMVGARTLWRIVPIASQQVDSTRVYPKGPPTQVSGIVPSLILGQEEAKGG
jgi:hypothetical protein